MTENYKRVYYKMSYYPPYKSSSNNIKVELDLTNYATKTDLNNITHVDTSSFASKANLAALKTEVDKIDADKLKTVPVDLAKLTNAVENDLVKKTVHNTKVTSVEGQLAGITKNTIDNLANTTKLKAIDTNSFVLKTKLAFDVTTLENKIDTVDKKIPDISGLATKTSLNAYLQTSTFIHYLKNDGRMHVYLSGNHFQQNKVIIPNNNNTINIYCVYKLDPIASSRDTTFTIQNALFGAMQITKMLLIIQKLIIKDMVYVLMKEVNLVIQ